MQTSTYPPCLTTAWSAHERELRGWLVHRLGNVNDAEDALHDLFVKAMRQEDRFCSIHNARAWLFEVARNMVTDRLRSVHDNVELPEDIIEETDQIDPVDTLTACLPRVLSELSEEDREAIRYCDLQGMSQAQFAQAQGLILSAAKSRVQRARQRMRERMIVACQVQLRASGKVDDFTPRS